MSGIETMRRQGRQLSLAFAICTLGIAANIASVPALAQDSTTQDATAQRTDGQIEMDVVHALDAAPALKPDWITAGTVQGEVTLSGTTGSDANRHLAESIAAKVAGVTKVVNNLKVGDPQVAQDESGQQQGQDQGEYPDQYPNQGQPTANNNSDQPMAPIPPPGMQQQGPRPGYQPYAGQNSGRAQSALVPEPMHEPVTLAPGTLLKVRSSEPLGSRNAKIGSPVEFTVVRDVYAGGVLAVPRGATIRGEVTDAKSAGALGGSAELGLKIDALEMGGQSYPLDSSPFLVKGPNKTGHTVGSAIGGAVGGGGGAAIGAAAGGVGGTAASAATPGPRVWIPAEAIMDFHLNTPLTVTPVSSREAQRLAANAPPPSQRPTLYRRPYYPYGYPPPPPPGYYYRPY